MPSIAVTNSKGGAGKSTASLCLALALVKHGHSVTLIDADNNETLVEWKTDTESAGLSVPEGLTIVKETIERKIAKVINQEAERSTFVIVDVRGAANMLLAEALTHTDIALIPFQPKKLDAKQVSKILDLIYETEERMKRYNWRAKFITCFTRTNYIQTKRQKQLRGLLEAAEAPILPVELVEQVPLERLWDGGTLWDQLEIYKDDPTEVKRINSAIENVEYFTKALLEYIKTTLTGE